jgi:hypothetical protein
MAKASHVLWSTGTGTQPPDERLTSGTVTLYCKSENRASNGMSVQMHKQEKRRPSCQQEHGSQSLLLWTRAKLGTPAIVSSRLSHPFSFQDDELIDPYLTSLINTWLVPLLSFHFRKNKRAPPLLGRRERKMATMKLGSKPEIFVLEGLTWLLSLFLVLTAAVLI